MNNTKFYKSPYSPSAGQLFIINTILEVDTHIVSQSIIIHKKSGDVIILDSSEWPNLRISINTLQLAPKFIDSNLVGAQRFAFDNYMRPLLDPREAPVFDNFATTDETFLFDIDKLPTNPERLFKIKSRSIDAEFQQYIDNVIKVLLEANAFRQTGF
jgi:hypothetical protein